MKQLLYILFLLFLLAACRENKKDQFARLVQEWQGKEIVFPQDMERGAVCEKSYSVS